ncbi:MAG: DNA repair protein RadA [Candidatus Sumerlaeaceae bacterium]
MAKSKIQFVCQECGEGYPKWAGKCTACGQWNTLVEERVAADPAKAPGAANRAAFRLRHDVGERRTVAVPITQINALAENRTFTHIDEFDRILGGGIVAGSVTLIGGEPGIGKSTLLLQVAQRLASAEKPSLYVSGEESLEQMRLRASRMGALSDHLLCLSETEVEAIGDQIVQTMPSCVIVDSIQTAYTPEISGAPGSVSQIRESAAHLLFLCKQLHVPLFLVGHLTKSGVVAGPRILEHMVDTVLYFEGDRHHNFRILRAVKNRFGSTNEIGIFEMVREGLAEVKNPSELFLQERPEGASGSVVVPVLEGTRPLLVEIQALTAPNGGFGSPRRSANGIDARRMNLLIAVLEKRLGIRMFDQDVYVNIAGGVRVDEPAADLAALCAMVSSFRGQAVEQDTIILGEVGLAGEIRSVSHLEKRLTEAARLGFKKAVTSSFQKRKPPAGMQVQPAKNVGEALRLLGLG